MPDDCITSFAIRRFLRNGVNTYAYDSADRLISVTSASGKVTMAYDGLGQRLSMSAAGVTTQYVLDNGQPLEATSGGKTTAYLYGVGPVGQMTDSWAYDLSDGTNTPRQLVSAQGQITYSARYTPWGDTMQSSGTGNFTYGYLGGLMDSSTGLLYVGSGQYYDPSTGRFLNRNAKPDQTNPYVPWGGNPTGALFAPLALLSLVYSRRKKRGTLDIIIVLVVIGMSIGMSLTVWDAQPAQAQQSTAVSSSIVMPIPSQNEAQSATVTVTIPTSLGTPVNASQSSICMAPISIPLGQYLITHYVIVEENDPYFNQIDGNIPIATGSGWDYIFAKISVYHFAYGNASNPAWSVNVNGTGILNDPRDAQYGRYLHVYASRDGSHPWPHTLFEFLGQQPQPACGGALEAWSQNAQEVTIAVSQDFLNKSQGYTCGEKFTIDLYPGKIFKIADAGTFTDHDHFDIYVGPMQKGNFDTAFGNVTSKHYNVQQVQ